MNCLPGQWVSLSCWLSSMAAQDKDSKSKVLKVALQVCICSNNFICKFIAQPPVCFAGDTSIESCAQSLQLEVLDLCMGPAFQCSLRSQQQPSKLLKQKASADFALGMRQADAGCLQLDSAVGL